jgi:hypothetical protein
MYIVPREDSIQYAWDDISAPRKLLMLSIAGQERVVDLLRFGKQEPLSFTSPGKATQFVEIQVLAEGPVIVLRVSPLGKNRAISSSQSKIAEKVFYSFIFLSQISQYI